MRSFYRLLLVAAVTLLAPGASRAQARYNIQAIVNGGDRAGDFVVCPCGGGSFDPVGLNDAGQVSVLVPGQTLQTALLQYGPGGLAPIARVGDTVGGLRIDYIEHGPSGPSQNGDTTFMGHSGSGDVLAQFGGGKLTVIAAVGMSAAGVAPGGGTWSYLDAPTDPFPVNMNDRGEVVFSGVVKTPAISSGTFRWDPQAQQIAPVAIKGMRRGANLTLDGSGLVSPGINNEDEIVFEAFGKDDAGKSVQGLFLLDPHQNVQTVALLGQTVPGGDQISYFYSVVLNDAGVVAFVATRQSDQQQAVYRWANGTITPTGVALGANAPGGGKFTGIDGVLLNSVNANVLVAARTDNPRQAGGLYLFASGQLNAEAAPGQTLPDGSMCYGYLSAQVSRSNAAGQICFITQAGDGTAAYRMEPDGRLSPVLQSGTPINLGTIQQVGSLGGTANGVGINNKGQIALPAELLEDINQRDAILLLTPSGP